MPLDATTSRVLKTTVRWLTRIFLLGVVGLIFAAATIVTVLPRATHGAALTVLTGSMTPKIPVGSIVLVKPVDPGTLHVGDVATYQKAPGQAEYITHRIVAINTATTPTTFTFKGDANRGPDINPVPATAIRGKVWFSVPYLGSIRDAVHTKGMVMLLGLIALIGYALVQLTSGLRERRRTNRPARHRGGEATPADASTATPAETTAAVQPISPDDDGLPPVSVTRGRQEEQEKQEVFLATFRAGLVGRLSRESVTWVLGGVLLKHDEREFTVVVVEAVERAPMVLTLLETLDPLHVERFIATPSMTPSNRPVIDLSGNDSSRTELVTVSGVADA
jgi:signal peptidase